MNQERLQKLLARAGFGSRRSVEEMIREGRITINGRVADLGDKADPEIDSIKLDSRRISVTKIAVRSYYLLNKPGGYVSTREDPEGRPTVLDLLPERLHRGLFPVGRLDFDTEGLLLLTNDGDLALHLTHPRYGSYKTYEVKVKGHPQNLAIEKLRSGIIMEGRRTAPAQISRLQGVGGMRDAVQCSWWQVILQEGRTRQIREMFFRIGHPVRRLRRVAISGLKDPRLRLGTWRKLTDEEVELLRNPPRLPADRSSRKRPRRKMRPAESNPRNVPRRQGRPDSRDSDTSNSRGRGRPNQGRPSAGRPSADRPAQGRPSDRHSSTDRSSQGGDQERPRGQRPSRGRDSRSDGSKPRRPSGPPPGGRGGRPGRQSGKRPQGPSGGPRRRG